MEGAARERGDTNAAAWECMLHNITYRASGIVETPSLEVFKKNWIGLLEK